VQIAGSSVDQRCLGSAQPVRAELERVEADASNPLADEASVFARRPRRSPRPGNKNSPIFLRVILRATVRQKKTGRPYRARGSGAVDLNHCVDGDSKMELWAEQLRAEAGERERARWINW
jgi:hypothetical protein